MWLPRGVNVWVRRIYIRGVGRGLWSDVCGEFESKIVDKLDYKLEYKSVTGMKEVSLNMSKMESMWELMTL